MATHGMIARVEQANRSSAGERLMNPRTRLPDAGTPAEVPERPSDAESAEKEKENERLDEELAETFPASDPIPFQHDA
jgi:hypothetical protein